MPRYATETSVLLFPYVTEPPAFHRHYCVGRRCHPHQGSLVLGILYQPCRGAHEI